jgi:HEPN domain-containing protein
MNWEKQVDYWVRTSEEDAGTATDLMEIKRWRAALFFAHLALEKILKAHVCQKNLEYAPKLHNLVKLAEIAGLELTEEQIDVLTRMNMFNLAGRYPRLDEVPLEPERAAANHKESLEVHQWLLKKLRKA